MKVISDNSIKNPTEILSDFLFDCLHINGIYYFCELKIRKFRMMSSQENIMLTLSESPRTAFNSKSISLLLNEKRDTSLAKRLNYYVQKGLLLNPRKGIYAKRNSNPEELAGLVFVPSYISLEYVLQKSGVIFQYDSAITSVSYLSREIEMLGQTFRYRQIKGEILYNLEGIERRDNINIATPERAILDMMYLNSECYFDNLNAVSKKRIKQLLPIYQSQKLTERVDEMFK